MFEGVEIKGGAGEFEAAVIGIVLDHVAREQEAIRQRRRPRGSQLPAWVRVISPQAPEDQIVTPEDL